MPEPVNSVVLGDPESFLAEQLRTRAPEMGWTVKPIISEQAQTESADYDKRSGTSYEHSVGQRRRNREPTANC